MIKEMNEDAAAHALAAILRGMPTWNPREGDLLGIRCGTSYVLSPFDLEFRLTKPVIEAARVISGISEWRSPEPSLESSESLMARQR